MNQEVRRILVVDDEVAICQVIQDYLVLRQYDVATAGNYDEALRQLENRQFDVILSDIRMPGKSGTDLLRHVRRHHPQIAVILFTGYADIGLAVHSMQEGAYDFILKPIHLEQVYLSIHNALEKRALKAEVRKYQKGLEELVERRTRELREALRQLEASSLDTITRLSRAAEMRDDETGNHVLRIRAYTAALCRELKLPREDIDHIYVASSMHDIGKIGIPDAILLKPGRLDPQEFEIMKGHALIGAKILQDAEGRMLQIAEIIARTHHEKWDGSGYPFNLVGEKIPIYGRIVALADVFDALTNKRCYKPAFDLDTSIEIIRKSSGSHFDPDVVDAFMRIRDEFAAIRNEFREQDNSHSTF
jgi:putative two-component system response regulator